MALVSSDPLMAHPITPICIRPSACSALLVLSSPGYPLIFYVVSDFCCLGISLVNSFLVQFKQMSARKCPPIDWWLNRFKSFFFFSRCRANVPRIFSSLFIKHLVKGLREWNRFSNYFCAFVFRDCPPTVTHFPVFPAIQSNCEVMAILLTWFYATATFVHI